jgi:hypothetical protein
MIHIDSERSPWEADVTEPGSGRRCTNCDKRKPDSEFYSGVRECKACKRDRSRRDRAVQARKLAAFERFVDALITLAGKTSEAPAGRRTRTTAKAVA